MTKIMILMLLIFSWTRHGTGENFDSQTQQLILGQHTRHTWHCSFHSSDLSVQEILDNHNFPARSGERQRPWEDGEDREDVGGARKRVGPSEKCFSSEEDPKVCATRRSWYSLLVSIMPFYLSLFSQENYIYLSISASLSFNQSFSWRSFCSDKHQESVSTTKYPMMGGHCL